MTGGKASLFTFTDAIIDLDEFFSDMDDLTPEKRELLDKEASDYEASFKEPEFCVTDKSNSSTINEFVDSDFEELTSEDLLEDKELFDLFKNGTSLGDILSGKEVLLDKEKDEEIEKKSDVIDNDIDFDDIEDSIFGNLNDDKAEKVESCLDNDSDLKESESLFDGIKESSFDDSDFDNNFGDIEDSIFGGLNDEISEAKLDENIKESDIKDFVGTPNNISLDEDININSSKLEPDDLSKDFDAEHNLGDSVAGNSLFDIDSDVVDDEDLLELEREEARLKLEAEEAFKRQQEQIEAVKKKKEELKQKALERRRKEELEKQQELERQKELERQQELEKQKELERQKELEKQKELESNYKIDDNEEDSVRKKELINLINKYMKKSHSDSVEVEEDDDIETLELKLDLAKLAYKKYLKKLKRQQEEDLEYVCTDNNDLSKVKPTTNNKSINSIIPPEISLANQTVSEKEKELEMYSSMATDDLFKIVKQYLLAKGVRNELVPLDDVINKFGKDNVKRLKDKSYVIIIRNGLTLG